MIKAHGRSRYKVTWENISVVETLCNQQIDPFEAAVRKEAQISR